MSLLLFVCLSVTISVLIGPSVVIVVQSQQLNRIISESVATYDNGNGNSTHTNSVRFVCGSTSYLDVDTSLVLSADNQSHAMSIYCTSPKIVYEEELVFWLFEKVKAFQSFVNLVPNEFSFGNETIEQSTVDGDNLVSRRLMSIDDNLGDLNSGGWSTSDIWGTTHAGSDCESSNQIPYVSRAVCDVSYYPGYGLNRIPIFGSIWQGFYSGVFNIIDDGGLPPGLISKWTAELNALENFANTMSAWADGQQRLDDDFEDDFTLTNEELNLVRQHEAQTDKTVSDVIQGLNDTRNALELFIKDTSSGFQTITSELESTDTALNALYNRTNTLVDLVYDNLHATDLRIVTVMNNMSTNAQQNFYSVSKRIRDVLNSVRDLRRLTMDMYLHRNERRQLTAAYRALLQVADDAGYVPFLMSPGMKPRPIAATTDPLAGVVFTWDSVVTTLDTYTIIWAEYAASSCIYPGTNVTHDCSHIQKYNYAIKCSKNWLLDHTDPTYGWQDIIEQIGVNGECDPTQQNISSVVTNSTCRCWIEKSAYQHCYSDYWPTSLTYPDLTSTDFCKLKYQSNDSYQSVSVADSSTTTTIYTKSSDWINDIYTICTTSRSTQFLPNQTLSTVFVVSRSTKTYFNVAQDTTTCGNGVDSIIYYAAVNPTIWGSLLPKLEIMLRFTWSQKLPLFEKERYGTLGEGVTIEENNFPVTTAAHNDISKQLVISFVGVPKESLMVPVYSLKPRSITKEVTLSVPDLNIFDVTSDPILTYDFDAPKQFLRVGSKACSVVDCEFACVTPGCDPTRVTQKFTFDTPASLLSASSNPLVNIGKLSFLSANRTFPGSDRRMTMPEWRTMDASRTIPNTNEIGDSLHKYFVSLTTDGTRQCVDANDEYNADGSWCSTLDHFYWDPNSPSGEMWLTPRSWSYQVQEDLPYGSTISEYRIPGCPDVLVGDVGDGGRNVILINSRTDPSLTCIVNITVSGHPECFYYDTFIIGFGQQQSFIAGSCQNEDYIMLVTTSTGTLCSTTNLTIPEGLATGTSSSTFTLIENVQDLAVLRAFDIGLRMTQITQTVIDYTQLLVQSALANITGAPFVVTPDPALQAQLANQLNQLINNSLWDGFSNVTPDLEAARNATEAAQAELDIANANLVQQSIVLAQLNISLNQTMQDLIAQQNLTQQLNQSVIVLDAAIQALINELKNLQADDGGDDCPLFFCGLFDFLKKLMLVIIGFIVLVGICYCGYRLMLSGVKEVTSGSLTSSSSSSSSGGIGGSAPQPIFITTQTPSEQRPLVRRPN